MARNMHGASVHILQHGEFNDTHGVLVNSYYDENTHNMIYKVRMQSGKLLDVPAVMAALYFPVNTNVRILCGTYINHKATVTATRFDGDSYSQRVRISSPAFPHDIHIDIPVSHIARDSKQFE
jgi:hypothetical protein